jgi:glycerophosphoryl diester phosphodiesterase
LAELLDSWPEIRINIDPKHDSAVVPLLAELRAHNALDRVCIGSFSGKRLRHIRDELGPAVCTSIGPVDIVRLVLGQFGIPIGSIGADAVQIPMSQGPIPVTTKRLVDEAHSRGLAVHVWTIDEADQMEHLLDLGVDGIMTDRPVVLRDVFASRNLWY